MWCIPEKLTDKEIFERYHKENGGIPTLQEWVESGRSPAGYYRQKKEFLNNDEWRDM